MGESYTIKKVEISKMKVDNGEVEFKVTCAIGRNIDLNELAKYLNTQAELTIEPFQSELPLEGEAVNTETEDAVTA